MSGERFTFIRRLRGWRGDARLYRADPPVRYDVSRDYEANGFLMTDYVIASATIAFTDGPETLVFAATKDGQAINYSKIGGVRGELDHAAALATVTS